MQEPVVPKGVAHVVVTPPAEPETIVFVLLDNLSMLAFTSAIEPLRIANQLTGHILYRWTTMSADGENVRCSNGIEIGIDRPIGETPANSRVFVCSGVQPERSLSTKVADWVRLQWRLGRTVGSLCTGAYTLAKAGILGGHKFTPALGKHRPFSRGISRIWIGRAALHHRQSRADLRGRCGGDRPVFAADL